MASNALEDEMQALSAIYGNENVLFSEATVTMPATVSVTLDSCIGKVALSAQLAEDYPAMHPGPTLRSDSLSVSECEKVIKNMLEKEQSTQGEVCLFEYCETVLNVLQEHKDTSVKEQSPRDDSKKIAEQVFQVFHGEPLTDRKSVFQAHMAFISSPEDVGQVIKQLCQSKKVENATHNTMAWRVNNEEDFDDDGEKSAGKVMLHVLRQFDAKNTLCVVSRWFGGILLGPVRFRHIANVTRDILVAHEEAVRAGSGH